MGAEVFVSVDEDEAVNGTVRTSLALRPNLCRCRCKCRLHGEQNLQLHEYVGRTVDASHPGGKLLHSSLEIALDGRTRLQLD